MGSLYILSIVIPNGLLWKYEPSGSYVEATR